MRCGWFFSILAAAAVLAAEPPKTLGIETTFTPEECVVKAAKGDKIEVHYTGTLFSTGAKFDSSLDRGSPLPLTLGVGQVIKGWDEGLIGMCAGEKRTLTIPSDMAYGSRGFGNIIPAHSALVFTVELVSLDSKISHEELLDLSYCSCLPLLRSRAMTIISRLPLPSQPLLIHRLTPDPRTPSTKAFLQLLRTTPSIQRRARLLASAAHFSFVTPFPVEFPYQIEPLPDTDTASHIEEWLTTREALSCVEQTPLSKYTRENPARTVLLGIAETTLRDCLPHLDVGDAFAVIGSPSLVPKAELDDTAAVNTARDDLVDVLSGQAVLMSEDLNFAPWSMRYSGHQFGTFAGQLGDGRATTVLVTAPPDHPHVSFELQLKGQGRTPFSRSADGLAVIRSSIREYLCSEAMHALGILTTRALALISLPDLSVIRETKESACVVTRVAPSFLRIGSFEAFNPPQNVFLFGGGQQSPHWEALRILGEWVAGPILHLPEMDALVGKPWAKALLLEVARRNARMVASWQAYGFMHGVINTDNVSVLGLTIDYGPFAFMDVFDWHHICNHTDEEGRYAYRAQPTSLIYALRALNTALAPLIGAESESGSPIAVGWADGVDEEQLKAWKKVGEQVKDEMETVAQTEMAEEYGRLMRKRLALRRVEQADEATLVRPLLDLMAKHKLDFHATFRALAAFRPSIISVPSSRIDGINPSLDAFVNLLLEQVPNPTGLERAQAYRDVAAWLQLYGQRIERETDAWGREIDAERLQAARAANPRFVLRQWVLQEVIKKVEDDPIRGRRILAKVFQMATNPFKPWGEEDGGDAELSDEEREERRLCEFGAKDMLGFQCSCSS
ncbi:hypothetical protein MIND_00228300 [Mycena indigotica]|uniref:peptidylprolyl isomerase n=1 Tax=Mycena indigotica TaxID=2126181 RepID=A0A8H6T888_9AGAR|nr:uncharacterized protein MIND_00228300 [Mycena indigotica]KAF7312157.1 hypothetical protein MIND_00228300 [Mycena indigotica]